MAELKEYQIRLDQYKRPFLVVRNSYEVDKVHDISGTYDSVEIIKDTLNELFEVSNLAEEYVWMFTLSAKHHITGVFEVSHGSVNRSIFPVREIMQRALLAGAVEIIVGHCHPSGDPSPSTDDIAVTKKLNDACKFMGINLLDHIIIGCEEPVNYYSFYENKVMEGW